MILYMILEQGIFSQLFLSLVQTVVFIYFIVEKKGHFAQETSVFSI